MVKTTGKEQQGAWNLSNKGIYAQLQVCVGVA